MRTVVMLRTAMIFAAATSIVSVSLAEEPVGFGHWAIKAAVEEQLGVDSNEPSGSAYPVLVGSEVGPVLCFNKGEARASRLDGFMILGGKGGPAILCDGSSPILSHCLVVGKLY